MSTPQLRLGPLRPQDQVAVHDGFIRCDQPLPLPG